VTRDGNASGKQDNLSLAKPGDETITGKRKGDTPVHVPQVLERVLERGNLLQALRQVVRNKGGPGVDGMTIDRLPGHLKKHWPHMKAELLSGKYKPQPVKRVEIPKAGGGVRKLGVPTVTDRLIQQALMQVLQAEWDSTFSHSSYGFRPNRSAHQAVACAQGYLRDGYNWVVDIDLEKFFDRVDHDVLMHRVRERVKDSRVLRLITGFLRAGVSVEGVVEPTREGTPQGGPLSPLLANLLLDDLDKELESRGHRFVRYADDCNVYVRSKRAGERVMESVSRFLTRRLKLKVNGEKSAIDRPWKRTFLGFTFTSRRPNRRRVSAGAIEEFKQKVRRLTQRTRGKKIRQIIGELMVYLIGWKGYYGFTEAPSPLRDLDKWIRRRLRCYVWKQWGRRRYKELRERGVSRELAWNTVKSAHGPWRISQSPALSYALPEKFFRGLGLQCLVAC
jgi:RNA-directed DNA polymerase